MRKSAGDTSPADAVKNVKRGKRYASMLPMPSRIQNFTLQSGGRPCAGGVWTASFFHGLKVGDLAVMPRIGPAHKWALRRHSILEDRIKIMAHREIGYF